MSSPTAPPSTAPAPARQEAPRALWGLVLVVAILVTYAPTLGAGWLDYDDDWLVRRSPFLAQPSADGLWRMWTDLGRATRIALGAEYLPVRDTSEWISALLLGVSPAAHHAIDVALYVVACLLLRAWLHAALPDRSRVVELATLLFATHPVHAESVAWIAGRKDVLLLVFTFAALRAYASPDARTRRALTPIAIALACLSKAPGVVTPILLLAHDVLARRAPDRVALGISLVPAALAALLHIHVGATVGMIAPLPGGSRLGALATMAPVWWRYLGLVVGVEPFAIAHDVPARTLADPVALASLLGLAALVGLAVWAWRRGERAPAVGLAWMLVALAPVSQIAAPLQNHMADRYLLVAVLGPLLLIALALDRVPARLRLGVGALVVLVCAGLGTVRALTFADPPSLWAEASEVAPLDPVGPYGLAMAIRAYDPPHAELAFREAARRDGLRTESGRRAMNNLAILLAGQGRALEAADVLESTLPHYPHDARIRANLARLCERVGRAERAAELRRELAERFPDYRPGQSARGSLPDDQ